MTVEEGRESRDMRVLDHDELRGAATGHDYPLLFATVSGAHLYGFPSIDSDVDLRGAHLLPTEELVGLRSGPDTIDRTWKQAGAEIDLVTHDAAKFFRLLLRPNGYVLEQLLSPLVIVTGPAHQEVVALASDCLTRRHAHHYRGFARTQWELFAKTGELKPLLYTMRVLLTGIHLIRTGELVAHLPTLIELVPGSPPYLTDLVAAKAEQEHSAVAATRVGQALGDSRFAADVTALQAGLDEAERVSPLPDQPTAEPQLHELLVRLRTSN